MSLTIRLEGLDQTGVVVIDPPSILQVVSEGGGMRQFSPHVRKVNLRVGTFEPEPVRSAI